jgi:hypothetical protein
MFKVIREIFENPLSDDNASDDNASGNNGLLVSASIDKVEKELEKPYGIDADFVNKLLEDGLLTHYTEEGDKVYVGFKNEQVKRCLTVEGQVLELKVFFAVNDAKSEDGVPVYQDAMNGVVIDWDGEFHNKSAGEEYDTENEVDIMLMHDIVPVFISCKNGQVTADELYKLQTVSQRFGGDYAKKVLVATALDALGDSANYLRQRAEDMNIQIIDNIQEISDEALLQIVSTLWDR